VNDGDGGNGTSKTRIDRALRFDVLIAVCALLISSLASAASWWQARLLSEQTHVLEEQLGAQVWPYVGVSETIDNATVTVSLGNDGLGPAVLRSLTVRVDGSAKASMIDALHAVLGSHLVKRKPSGEKMRVAVNGTAPGGVLRPGESTSLLTLTSKTFAQPFVRAEARIDYAVCYCAIVPGQCWLLNSDANAEPRPQAACREIPGDLLHTSPFYELRVPL
jgi:hypothetical protein